MSNAIPNQTVCPSPTPSCIRYTPRDLSSFLDLIYFLRNAPSIPIQNHRGQFVSDDDIIKLKNQNLSPKKKRRVAQYETDPVPALLNWILRTDAIWDRFIRKSEHDAELARGILHLVDFQLNTYHYVEDEMSSLTLVARRLIWLSASKFNIFKRRDLIDAMKSYGKWHLPKGDVLRPLPRGIPRPEREVFFQNCVRSTVNGFLLKASLFLQGKNIRGLGRDPEESELAEDRDLQFYLNDGGELMGFSVEPTHSGSNKLASIHQAHAAVTSMLAPDPRALIATRSLLNKNNFDPYKYERMSNRMRRRIVRVTAGMVSALTGTPLHEVLDISVLPPINNASVLEHATNSGISGEQRVIGYIRKDQEWMNSGLSISESGELVGYVLYILVGPSRHSGMSSRIKDQFIEIPLPRELSPMIHACRSEADPTDSTVQTFSVLIGNDALDKIRYGLKSTFKGQSLNGWAEKCFKTFIQRPEGAFRYLALNECGMPPAILSLVIGRPVGVWRSSLNYSCISNHQFFEAVCMVQKKLFLLSGFSNPTWHNRATRYALGAGLLKDGLISYPGIPEIFELVKEQKSEECITITDICAALDYLIRLFGGRFSKNLSHPSKDFLKEAGCLSLLDKNLWGKLYPRLIPLIHSIQRRLADPVLNKLLHDIKQYPPNDNCIAKFRNPTGDPNAGRKSLYSLLQSKFVGNEAISAVFGHGFAITKLYGPITPIPMTWFLGEIKMLFEQIADDTGINKAVESVPKVTKRQQRRILSSKKTLSGDDLPSHAPTELSDIDVGVQHLPVPNNETLEFLKLLWLKIEKDWKRYEKRPIELRRCLFLALSLHAMPFRRMWHLRYYICGNSIVRTDSEKTAVLFIAPIPQKDQGMGLIPLRLSESAAPVIWEMIKALSADSEGASIELPSKGDNLPSFDSCLLFPSFDKKEYQMTIRLAVRLTRSKRCKQSAREIEKNVLERLVLGTNFLNRTRFGAQVFNSLSGRAIVPSNYFALEDLLFQAFGKVTSLSSVTCQTWTNNFQASSRRKERENMRKKGKAHLQFDDKSNMEKLIENFATAYFTFPTTSKVEKWLTESDLILPRYSHDIASGKKRYSKERGCKLSARRISHKIMMAGDLPVGTPEHLLFPERTIRFFEIFDRILRNSDVDEFRVQIQWWVTILALLGCRAFEAPKINLEDLDDRFHPRIIRILGTKNHSAKRTLDLSLFSSDTVGAYLHDRLMKFGQQGFPLASSLNFPKNKVLKSCAEKVNNILGKAYEKLRFEIGLPHCSGAFTMNSLRHACAFRVNQAAVQETLWRGNLWTRIASVSTSMGHKSMVTTWSSYIGTASLVITWPSRDESMTGYCPLRDPTHDILFAQKHQ